MEKNWLDIQNKIGYSFKDKAVLKQALSHSSYVNECGLPRGGCNERLEFLGDAVLELISSEFLYNEYREIPEGELTKLRASLVCEPALAYDARQFSCRSIFCSARERSIPADATEIRLFQMPARRLSVLSF